MAYIYFCDHCEWDQHNCYSGRRTARRAVICDIPVQAETGSCDVGVAYSILVGPISGECDNPLQNLLASVSIIPTI